MKELLIFVVLAVFGYSVFVQRQMDDIKPDSTPKVVTQAVNDAEKLNDLALPTGRWKCVKAISTNGEKKDITDAVDFSVFFTGNSYSSEINASVLLASMKRSETGVVTVEGHTFTFHNGAKKGDDQTFLVDAISPTEMTLRLPDATMTLIKISN